MIQQRNFWMYLLLNIVTCGFYSWYFFYTTTRDINTMVGDDGRNTEPTTVLLFTLVTCGFYSYYWYYDQGNRIKALADRNNIPCNENGTSYLMWILLGTLICGVGSYIGIYLFIKNLNELISAYNASMYNSNMNGGQAQ
ncbi:MAG TPA: DUF4234 domain-containing protein [Candidatus Merdivicinus faecavium]|mgnify:CR=1 FL=1|nr:DUF4234 domain-containing protein [Candidatus Merdivicinus faecavium]